MVRYDSSCVQAGGGILVVGRSGYNDDIDNGWGLIRWRGAVAAAIRGKRGQAFLLEMWKAMQALPEKSLITDDLERGGAVCAIGAVGKARGVDMSDIDMEDDDSAEVIAGLFGIPVALAREVMWLNDEMHDISPEARFDRMRRWIEHSLLPVFD